jgi:hypothetical protein
VAVMEKKIELEFKYLIIYWFVQESNLMLQSCRDHLNFYKIGRHKMKTSRTKTIYRISIFFVIVIIKTYRFVIRLITKKVKKSALCHLCNQELHMVH